MKPYRIYKNREKKRLIAENIDVTLKALKREFNFEHLPAFV